MKKLMLGSAALIALTAGGPAMAADMAPGYKAPPPVYDYVNWTGFYWGSFAGALWGDGHWQGIALDGVPVNQAINQVDPRGAGVYAGFQFGANYQINYWVFG